MKNITLLLFSIILISAIGCNKDDDASVTPEVSVNQEEETILKPATVSSGIIINGATRNTGNPPTPNGNIPFSLNTDTQSAFLKKGFNISFDAPDTYKGAYIQIKSADGTVASDYLDVPANSFVLSGKKSKKLLKSIKNVDNNTEIEVNFANSIPPGKFCYIICIYDDAGNISLPSEVCVEVEAWGGNSNIAGNWNYTKQTRNNETIATPGTEECEDSTILCDNDIEILIEKAYCDTTLSLVLTFSSDGTYSLIQKSKDKNLNYPQTTETCTAIYSAEDEGSYTSEGNWAFDEEEGKLTLVEFKGIYENDNESETEIYENGELIFNGKTTINSSTLVIDVEDSDNDDVAFINKYHFSRQ